MYAASAANVLKGEKVANGVKVASAANVVLGSQR
jgi:hypothetical protein